MSDLIQQLASFLNLSKLVAVTVPGILATLALLLFFNPSPCKTDTGGACWYCQGQQKQDSSGKSKGAPSARAVGTYYVSKLTWEQANQSYKRVVEIARSNKVTDIDLSACGGLPEYIVNQSRLKSTKDTVKNLGDLEAVDPQFLLSDLDSCNSQLIKAQAFLARKDAAEQSLIAVSTTNLTNLSTALTAARSTSNSDSEGSLRTKVKDAKSELAGETQADTDFKSANTLIAALTQQIQTAKTPITTDASTLIATDPPPPKTTFQTAAQAIGNNVLWFLVVALVVGQLLDPLQRSLISFDPIRGSTFRLLNALYGADETMGEIRFGDHRYKPFHHAPADSEAQDSVADTLERQPHILDPNFAIGKGLITPADYASLQDIYYTQSQLATGLMIPLFLLASAIYSRLLCCELVKSDPVSVVGFLATVVGTLALLLFLLAAFAAAFSPSAEDDSTSAGKKHDAAKASNNRPESVWERWKQQVRSALEPIRRWLRSRSPLIIFTMGPIVVALFLAVLFGLESLWLPSWWLVSLAVGLPTLELICFVAGIDRLHNFYSELQARILGAATKQEESQIKKFADILTDPKPKARFVAELETRQFHIRDILKKLDPPSDEKQGKP